MVAVENLIRSMGLVVNNQLLYGPQHRMTLFAADQAFTALNQLFAKIEKVNLTVADKSLLADGRQVDPKNPLIASFVKQLVTSARPFRGPAQAGGFTLARGMPKEEFDKLISLLTTHPDKIKQMGNFSKAVAASSLQFIQAKAVTYQRVTDEEVVVKKEDVGVGSGGGNATLEQKRLAEVLAFIKGQIPEDAAEAALGITEFSADSAKLADLIYQAAGEEAQAQPGGKSMVDLVVACLKRVYETFLKDPASRTQQGKKNIAKALQMMQEELVAKLQAGPGGADAKAVEQLSGTVQEMIDDLKVDSLATEYTKKLSSVDSSEEKILKFIQKSEKSGLSDMLKERLIEGGLTEEGWEELLIKAREIDEEKGDRTEEAGDGSGKGGPAPEAPGMAALAVLLSQLGDIFNGTEGQVLAGFTPEALDQVVDQVRKKMEEMALRADEKIENLAEKVKEPVRKLRRPGAPPPVSRRELLALLAEIVQEFCQPLSVINCSLDMMKGGKLGPLSEFQKEMVNLSAESGARLQTLINKLLEISGVPVGLKPDAQILTEVYDKK